MSDVKIYVHLIKGVSLKYQRSGIESITDYDICRLFELSDDCVRKLKKYINPRGFMYEDEFLAKIEEDIVKEKLDSKFTAEIDWLQQFDRCFAERCSQFINSERRVRLDSTESLYQYCIRFREQFGSIYSIDQINIEGIRSNFEQFLEEILNIASGTALFCDDGIKFYKERRHIAILNHS
ncbi:MAG: hypothetical protein HC840_17845 [Leptolyngbyaceae cyanobacterium RM2_2_4]|nr:hypothetical protein [Leptolyngbyaceae cyanobacterium RM2_2_4]